MTKQCEMNRPLPRALEMLMSADEPRTMIRDEDGPFGLFDERIIGTGDYVILFFALVDGVYDMYVLTCFEGFRTLENVDAVRRATYSAKLKQLNATPSTKAWLVTKNPDNVRNRRDPTQYVFCSKQAAERFIHDSDNSEQWGSSDNNYQLYEVEIR